MDWMMHSWLPFFLCHLVKHHIGGLHQLSFRDFVLRRITTYEFLTQIAFNVDIDVSRQ